MTDGRIYMDYNATAPLRPGVADIVLETLQQPTNPSSIHGYGRAARAAVEKARMQVATLAGTVGNQVIFTGSATESNNMVLKNFSRQRVLISAIEHPSVAECVPDADIIPVTANGIVDLEAFEKLLDSAEPPALISVMLVNNETGAIQPVNDLVRRARTKHPHVLFHTDAVQAAGKIPVDFSALQVDYMSLSSHKIGGPQGAGALIWAPGAPSVKFLHGGGQESRQRAGTENVAALAGFGFAADRAHENLADCQSLAVIRDSLQSRLKNISPDLVILAGETPRVANTLCIAVPGIPAQTLLMALDLEGIAVSSGSACSSGVVKESLVARAMGLDPALTGTVVRISLGWASTPADTDNLVSVFAKLYKRLRHKTEAGTGASADA